jgi:hypothetical protein
MAQLLRIVKNSPWQRLQILEKQIPFFQNCRQSLFLKQSLPGGDYQDNPLSIVQKTHRLPLKFSTLWN